MQLNNENFKANFYRCCPSGVSKGALRRIRVESFVNKIDIFSLSFIFIRFYHFFIQDLTARLFFSCILIFLIH